jgi:predicted membrane protein
VILGVFGVFWGVFERFWVFLRKIWEFWANLNGQSNHFLKLKKVSSKNVFFKLKKQPKYAKIKF